jgi:hypothetical protein
MYDVTKERSMANFIPEELLYEIITYLKTPDLLSATRVNSEWHDICEYSMWVKQLPEWKKKRVPWDEWEFNERYSYAKEQMKDFYLAKKDAIYRNSFQGMETMKQERVARKNKIAHILEIVTLLQACLFVTLLGFGITNYSFHVVWAMYFTTIIISSFGTQNSLKLAALRVVQSAVAIQILLIQFNAFSWFYSFSPTILVICGLIATSCFAREPIREMNLHFAALIAIVFAALYFDGTLPYLTVALAPVYVIDVLLLREHESTTVRTFVVSFLVAKIIFNILYPVSFAWFAWLLCAPFVFRLLRPDTSRTLLPQ